MSATSARPLPRSSLAMTARARSRSDSTVASRASPTISRSSTANSASPASSANTRPTAPSQGARANKSSIRFVTARPSASSTSPESADQNIAPQGVRRLRGAMMVGRFSAGASARVSAARCASSGAAATSRGSSMLKMAGLRKVSVIATGPR
jgi:hypothetical protein